VEGTILQVNVSDGGLPKRPVSGAYLAELGVEGDRQAHPQIHGGPEKAVLLIAAEAVDALKERGYPVFYGALGENLTTRGLALRDLRIGDRLWAGKALIQITRPRGPCAQLDVYGASLQREIWDPLMQRRDPASPRWGLSGLYARVVAPGPVVAGDIIAVELA